VQTNKEICVEGNGYTWVKIDTGNAAVLHDQYSDMPIFLSSDTHNYALLSNDTRDMAVLPDRHSDTLYLL
jgi:hypothetical protein